MALEITQVGVAFAVVICALIAIDYFLHLVFRGLLILIVSVAITKAVKLIAPFLQQ